MLDVDDGESELTVDLSRVDVLGSSAVSLLLGVAEERSIDGLRLVAEPGTVAYHTLVVAGLGGHLRG